MFFLQTLVSLTQRAPKPHRLENLNLNPTFRPSRGSAAPGRRSITRTRTYLAFIRVPATNTLQYSRDSIPSGAISVFISGEPTPRAYLLIIVTLGRTPRSDVSNYASPYVPPYTPARTRTRGDTITHDYLRTLTFIVSGVSVLIRPFFCSLNAISSTASLTS